MTNKDTLPDPHPGLSPRLNAQVERVAEGGTGHPFLLSGHPQICPKPTRATITGSTFGHGGMLRIGFIGRSMNMEFFVRGNPHAYTTTTIKEVEEAPVVADTTNAGA